MEYFKTYYENTCFYSVYILAADDFATAYVNL